MPYQIRKLLDDADSSTDRSLAVFKIIGSRRHQIRYRTSCYLRACIKMRVKAVGGWRAGFETPGVNSGRALSLLLPLAPMIVILSLVAIHAVLVLVASFVIIRNRFTTRKEKVLQVLFSLLLPVFGPVAALAVYWSDTIKPEKLSDRYMGQSIDESRYPHGGRFW